MLPRLIMLVTVLIAVPTLIACLSPGRPPEPPAAPTIAQVAPALTPTPVAEAGEPVATLSPAQESTDWTQVAGVEGDLYVLGNPDAPVRIIDYSDFL